MISRLHLAVFISLIAGACGITPATHRPLQTPNQSPDVDNASPSSPPDDIAPQKADRAEADLPRETVYQPLELYQTYGGVTVQISKVVYSPTAATVELVVFATREYGFTWDDPVQPQYAYLNDILLADDEDSIVRQTSGEYGFARSDPSGLTAFDHVLTFEAPGPNAKALYFEISSIIISNLEAWYPIEFDFSDLSLGDSWQVDQSRDIGPISVVLGTARLIEASDPLHSFRLELDYLAKAREYRGAPIRVTCVRLFREPNSDFSRLQDSNCVDDLPTSYIEFGSPKILGPSLPLRPVQLRASTDIVVEGPWNLSWPIDQ